MCEGESPFDAGMGGSISFPTVNTNPQYRMVLVFSLTLAAMGALGLVGCASTQDSSSTAGSTGGSGSGSEVASASGPATPLAADVVYRPPPWEKVYREGKRTIRREARPVEGSPNKWVIEEFQSVDDKLKGGLVRQTYLERGADGSVFLTELNLTLENKVLTFDPPVVLMPAVLTMEKACISTSDVVLRDGSSDNATKSRGQATQTTRLVKQRDGAFVVSSELVAKFDFTTIDRTAEMEVIPGRGIVKEIQDRTVKFGLLNLSRSTSTAVLVEEPQ